MLSRRLVPALLTLALAAPAHATGSHTPAAPSTPAGSNAASNATAAASSHAQAHAAAVARQMQTQGQAQRQSAQGGNARASLANTGNSAVSVQGGTYTERLQAPSISSSLSLGYCQQGGGAGGSGQGFGLFFNFAKPDPDCTRQNDALVLNHLGRPDIALALMAQKGDVADAVRAVNEQQRARLEAELALARTPQGRPDYCTTASRAERRHLPECRG